MTEISPITTTLEKESIHLDLPERQEVKRLAEKLTETAPGLLDEPNWLATARDLSCVIPVALRTALRNFSADSGQAGAIQIHGLPVGPLPPTPARRESVERSTTLPASVLVLCAMVLGEVVAFRAEKRGALVQNVVPVPGEEQVQSNAGSVDLEMHIENAFHPHRPDFVALFCLRQDLDEEGGCASRQFGGRSGSSPPNSGESLPSLASGRTHHRPSTAPAARLRSEYFPVRTRIRTLGSTSTPRRPWTRAPRGPWPPSARLSNPCATPSTSPRATSQSSTTAWSCTAAPRSRPDTTATTAGCTARSFTPTAAVLGPCATAAGMSSAEWAAVPQDRAQQVLTKDSPSLNPWADKRPKSLIAAAGGNDA